MRAERGEKLKKKKKKKKTQSFSGLTKSSKTHGPFQDHPNPLKRKHPKTARKSKKQLCKSKLAGHGTMIKKQKKKCKCLRFPEKVTIA